MSIFIGLVILIDIFLSWRFPFLTAFAVICVAALVILTRLVTHQKLFLFALISITVDLLIPIFNYKQLMENAFNKLSDWTIIFISLGVITLWQASTIHSTKKT